MTPTDELRRMLDDRGVFWIDIPLVNMKRTCWKMNDEQEGYCYYEEDGFIVELTISNATPAQAIAATLGSGTCKNVHEPPKNTTFWPSPHFKCSECGATHVSMEYVFYCPNCGRKVVDA